MSKEHEALKLALEALENTSPLGFNMESDKRFYAAITAIREALAHAPEVREQPAPATELREQQLTAWVDAGDLKQLRKGDVIRVIRKGETYYSPFRYCGVLEECDYEYYRENSQFVYLEVGMATVEKIVYTIKDCTTGAIYADRGDRVEVAIEAKLRERNEHGEKNA